MKYLGAELYDGLSCDDCGWVGPLTEASEFNGELSCGNWQCCSGYVVEVHLCVKCREDVQWHDGRCIGCHEHHYEDGSCGCGAEEIVRRDQVAEVAELTRKQA